MPSTSNTLFEGLQATVRHALQEDIGSGDITAELIPEDQHSIAHVICREPATICGRPWVDEVFRQIDPNLAIEWHCHEGEQVPRNARVLTVRGKARAILTAERSALNFLQTLSAAATAAAHMACRVGHTSLTILDTRKTILGLLLAQKYAVKTGGCANHRIGLFDAYLIKENHINAAGGIAQVIARARELHADKPVEIEVETLGQLQEALDARADIIMLDNFNLDQLTEAVNINRHQAKLEASGGYTMDDIVAVAETGVDYISIGSLTKHVRAVDFSMLFD